MTPVAQSAHYHRKAAGLGSSPMAPRPKSTQPPAPAASPTLGQRLIRALVPAHFPTMVALQNRSGLAYSTLSNWKNGTKAPDWQSVELMAKLAGVDPLDLLGDRPAEVSSLRHHPDYEAAVAVAKARYRGRLPDGAYERAAATCTAQWPEHLDATFIYNLASFWWLNAPDVEVSRVEEAEVRAEMAAIDAKPPR